MKQFKILNKLGEGAFSVVYKAKRLSDNTDYALKKVKLGQLSEKEKSNAVNEVRILASINHPNIIGYKEAFFEDSTSSLCIVMEYADGGDLLSKINAHLKAKTHFSEEEIWRMFAQMVSGLKTLHDLKILHRDLKCANMFATKDGQIKIGDLNVSKVAKIGLVYTQTGTPYYASPEVWKDKPYDSRSDIWSLGCVLYEMCALHPPFTAPNMQGLFKKVTAGIYPELPRIYSSGLTNVVKMLLQVNPVLRPTCDQILNTPEMARRVEGKDVVKSMDQVLAEGGLLGTILLPKNLNALASRLPKPNYHPLALKKNPSVPSSMGSEVRRVESSQHSRGKNSPSPSALASIPESPRSKIPDSTPSSEDIKMVHNVKNRMNVPRPKKPEQHPAYYVPSPHAMHRPHNRGEDLGSLDNDLPEIRRPPRSEHGLGHRKVGSVEGRKRDEAGRYIADIYKANYLRSPAIVKDPRPGVGVHRQNRPPLPPLPYHVSPNPMRQAGVAVLERPQHYAQLYQRK